MTQALGDGHPLLPVPDNSPPKVVMYPRALIEFQDGESEEAPAESANFALVSPHQKDLAFKFKTNAESRGIQMAVQPAGGVIGPGASREVVATLLGPASAEALSELKFVVETWFPDEEAATRDGQERRTSRLRVPCARKGLATAGEGRCQWEGQPPQPLPPQGLTVRKGSSTTRSPHARPTGRKPAYLIDILPLAEREGTSGSMGSSEVLTYVISMLIWVGFGISIGKNYLCPCD